LSTRAAGFETDFQKLLDAKRETAAGVDALVDVIIEDVAHRGDAALIEYTRRFDCVDLTVSGLRLTGREIDESAAAASPETVTALRLAAERIEDFHRRQIPPPIDNIETFWSPAEKAMASQSLACSFVGSSMTVERGLSEFLKITKPDELIVAGLIYDQAARLRSYEITAEVQERLGSEERKVRVPAAV